MRVASRAALALASVLAVASLAPVSGHLYNHQSRHEDCEIHGAPQGHAADDGHAHWHHNAAAGAHGHAGVPAAAGHTHAFVAHDPCNQVGMRFPTHFAPAPPLEEVTVRDAAVRSPDPTTAPVIVGDEAFLLPVPLVLKSNLVIQGDAGLAALRLPGSGTPEDPYILEGYLVRNVLSIKDTSKCVVVRNNVIESDAVRGPLIDPRDIIDRLALLEALQDAIAEAQAHLTALQEEADRLANDAATLGPEAARLQGALTDALRDHQDSEAAAAAAAARLAGLAREAEGRSAERVRLGDGLDQLAALGEAQAAEQAVLDERTRRLTEAYDAHRADFEAFVAQYEDAEAPPADYDGSEAPATLQERVEAHAAAFAIFARSVPPPPPQEGPSPHEAAYQEHTERLAMVEGDLATLRGERDVLDDAIAAREAQAAGLLAELAGLDDAEGAAAGERAALEASLPGLEADAADAARTLDEVRAELADHDRTHGSALAAAADAQEAAADARARLDALLAEAAALSDRIAAGAYEWRGRAFRTVDDIVAHALGEARRFLNAADAGRLVLDWNGQCLHVHGNIVEDLRVNQNNDRTGYATGGIVEQNRIGTIGQIRHYDGEFRRNEVGDRAHLAALLDPTDAIAQPAAERAINNDGANQGWFHHNTIYGGVDLDFHGHHHGPGFFAPESHYHGSDPKVAYMVNPDGSFLLDANGERVLHHDHAKRWTTVRFTDNVVIDPNGNGLRFEDENHAGDDRRAASENLEVLQRPHFHRTHVELRGNTVLGHLRIDVFNADGIEVWSDDLSPVRRGATLDEVLDAVKHLGADILDTHPARNDGWVDVLGNTVLAAGRPVAFQVVHAKEAERMDISGNRAFVLADGADTGMDRERALEWLRGLSSQPPAQTVRELAAMGGTPRGDATVLRIAGIADSQVRLCGNVARGFASSVQATEAVRPDTVFDVCPDNDWGGAAAPKVKFTPYPVDGAHLSDAVREHTGGSAYEHVADPVLDDVDDAQDRLPGATDPLQDLVQGLIDNATALLQPVTDAVHDATDPYTDEHPVDEAEDITDPTPVGPLLDPVYDEARRLL